MSTRGIRKRANKIQEKLSPEDGGMLTLEQLCRAMWRQDRKRYMEGAAEGDSTRRFLKRQFEQEDADRAARRLSCNGTVE